MDKLSEILACALGPALYRINRIGTAYGRKYPINSLESLGDSAVTLMRLTWSLGVYTSPIVMPYLLQRGSLSLSGSFRGLLTTLVKLVSAVASIFGGGLLLRGYGRWTNPEYLGFLTSFHKIRELPSDDKRRQDFTRHFDFDFKDWPVDYKWSDYPSADPKKPPTQFSRRKNNRKEVTRMEKMKSFPLDVISFLAVHSFARRMMYPGSMAMVQKAMHSMLLDGRTRMIERFSAQRFKLETHEGNHIDSMFIDRRNTSNQKGSKLVICCEGNAGFYEVGIMCTPIDAGYSVLGWNHPGFAGSTGLPFPDQVMSAADTVMKFAIDKLKFKTEDIVIFAWSIGGYPSSWLAQQYPDIHGLILDATFDDVVPLAVSKMPCSWKPMVVNTVRKYFNLNISENLSFYNGPVLIIRRLKDEIIHTIETDPIKTNRANDLLIKLLETRFPNLLTDENPMYTLLDFLSGDPEHQQRVLRNNMVHDSVCHATLISYVEAKGQYSYPVEIGAAEEKVSEELKTQLALFLAWKHLADLDSTHCTPLPRNMFNMPYDLFREASRTSSSPGKL